MTPCICNVFDKKKKKKIFAYRATTMEYVACVETFEWHNGDKVNEFWQDF